MLSNSSRWFSGCEGQSQSSGSPRLLTCVRPSRRSFATKSFGAVRQIVIDLPDVDLDAVPMGRRATLLDLVAVFSELALRRQHVARVMGQSAPEHVGQDHVETVFGQEFGRPLPIARIGPRARMVPHGPAFARDTPGYSRLRLRSVTLGDLSVADQR